MYVLYASATGNAEVIAKRIHQEAIIKKFQSTLQTLNDFKKTISKREDLSAKEMTLIVVCSTTGNGDVPENGDMFYRFIKRKTTKASLFEGVHYGVLGLGDTNYDKFNNAAKLIDARLQELGAKSLCMRGDADDAVGLEEVVEPWITNLWNQLDNIYNLGQENMHPIEVETTSEATSDAAIYRAGLQPCFIQVDTVTDEITPTILDPSCQPHKKTSTVQSSDYTQEQYTMSHPFLALVCGAKYLTSSTADKQVLHLELNTAGSNIAFTPGDAIAIQCQNTEDSVIELMARLSIQRNERVRISCKQDEFRSCFPANVPLDAVVSVYDLLLNRIDLTAPVTPSILRMLAEYCSDHVEKSELLMLSTSVNQTAYRVQIQQQRANIMDLLQWFPSCQPPLAHLIQLLPTISPRYYSIANSPLKYSEQIHFAFTIVEYVTPPPLRLQRTGICTSWLKSIATRYLMGEDVYVPIFLKQTPEFSVPRNLHTPMIMIGPGTGVAPFRGFLQHRECLMINEQETMKKQCKGTNWLFFGCRKRDRDFLYRQELRNFETQSPISLNLLVATSQESTESGIWYGGSYVQDLLKEYASSIVNIMNNKNGFLYVCGDANSMAKDVHRVLRGIITEEMNCSREEAEAVLEKWTQEGRYQKDVWT